MLDVGVRKYIPIALGYIVIVAMVILRDVFVMKMKMRDF